MLVRLIGGMFFIRAKKGLLYVTARGVRKPSAKLAAHVEDFMLTRIVIAQNYGPGTLAGAHIERPHSALRSTLETLSGLNRVQKIVVKLVRSEQRDDAVFDLLCTLLQILDDQCLDASGNLEREQDFLMSAFLLKLYDTMGYTMPLDVCASCGTVLTAARNYADPYSGGILCKKCAASVSHASAIDPSTLKAMRLITTHELAHIPKIKVPSDVIAQLRILSDHMATWIMR